MPVDVADLGEPVADDEVFAPVDVLGPDALVVSGELRSTCASPARGCRYDVPGSAWMMRTVSPGWTYPRGTSHHAMERERV